MTMIKQTKNNPPPPASSPSTNKKNSSRKPYMKLFARNPPLATFGGSTRSVPTHCIPQALEQLAHSQFKGCQENGVLFVKKNQFTRKKTQETVELYKCPWHTSGCLFCVRVISDTTISDNDDESGNSSSRIELPTVGHTNHVLNTAWIKTKILSEESAAMRFPCVPRKDAVAAVLAGHKNNQLVSSSSLSSSNKNKNDLSKFHRNLKYHIRKQTKKSSSSFLAKHAKPGGCAARMMIPVPKIQSKKTTIPHHRHQDSLLQLLAMTAAARLIE